MPITMWWRSLLVAKLVRFFQLHVLPFPHSPDVSFLALLNHQQGSIGKLRKEAERAKRALTLSRHHQVRVEIESLLSEPLSRSRFEELNNENDRGACEVGNGRGRIGEGAD
ncbi:Endoplasmic reticulum chaperone BiP [Linum perenne]